LQRALEATILLPANHAGGRIGSATVEDKEMIVRRIASVVGLLWLATGAAGAEDARERLAKHLVEKAGVRRGVCAVLGDGTIARYLARASELLVHVVEPSGWAVEARRKALAAEGLYGTRVVVEKGTLRRLPYADNLIDAVVATALSDRALGGVSPAEIVRVLRPGGVALIGQSPLGPAPSVPLSEPRLRQWVAGVRGRTFKDAMGVWAEIRKPFPDGIDDWTHWQHGPDNNPMSTDRVIRAPYMTQFLAKPWFSTMPSISVISRGRMFRAAGHMAIHEREERYLNTLYATNAYNGALLWTRPIPRGFLAHRSLFVATPDTLYWIESEHCLLLDPQTGAERDRIPAPREVTRGRRWTWIALNDGVLYALFGGKGYEAEVIRRKRPHGHWGWNELSKGYYEKKYPWGGGHSLLAMNPKTKKVLWVHEEKAPIDSRALCLGYGRIFLHSEGNFVAALAEKTGKVLWKTSEPRLLRAISQPWTRGLGFKTTPYTICTNQALYFGGRGRRNVVAVSAEDGRMLWVRPGCYNATNLLFRGAHLYAHIPSCMMLNPLTGEVVRDLQIKKRSCARLTGCPDGLFHRGCVQGGEGTTRYGLALNRPTVIHAFRPPCNDGIIPAGGLLHVTPWDCDCNLQLMGAIALCPAGGFQFGRQATEAERLETVGKAELLKPLVRSEGFPDPSPDWDTYRGDTQRSSSTSVEVPRSVQRQWEFRPRAAFSPSAPAAAGGAVFLGGDDGIARAIDAATGRLRWTFCTAGPIRVPPTLSLGRAYFGSADGYVYALRAESGEQVWRFRAAPVERRIMVFGKLCSTWPVNSGVVVHKGVAYAAAGIINYDGTHVYALDALTGKIRWQNNSSGHLNRELREGVSAQGDLAVCGDKLLLAGGNVTSPGVYSLSDGKCLNNPPGAGWPGANQGSMVCAFLGKYPMIGGRRLFTQDDDFITNWKMRFDIHAPDNVQRRLKSGFVGRVAPAFGHGVVATSVRKGPLVCLHAEVVEAWIKKPEGKRRRGAPQPKLPHRWRANSIHSCVAIVVAPNAVVAAGCEASSGKPSVQAFELGSGKRLWAQPLPAAPLPNGLCVDRAARVIAVLADGEVVCFASK